MNDTEQLIMESLLNFANALEVAVFTLKREVTEELMGVNNKDGKFNWNIDSVKWIETEGTKGYYDKSTDVNNIEFRRLLKYLADHGGKLRHAKHFYWVFVNGHDIGRKLLAKTPRTNTLKHLSL